MWLTPDSDDIELTPQEERGLREIDRLVYTIRRLLKSLSISFAFQSPSFSPRSTTLVFLDEVHKDALRDIHSELERLGFLRTEIGFFKPLEGGLQLLVAFPRVDTQDGHTNRMAIRVAYQLSRTTQ